MPSSTTPTPLMAVMQAGENEGELLLELDEELQEKYEDLEQHFLNLPGYDNYDDVDLESLKQSR